MITLGKLSLVDLAGSERAAMTGAAGELPIRQCMNGRCPIGVMLWPMNRYGIKTIHWYQ
jgi:hypothetical protein